VLHTGRAGNFGQERLREFLLLRFFLVLVAEHAPFRTQQSLYASAGYLPSIMKELHAQQIVSVTEAHQLGRAISPSGVLSNMRNVQLALRRVDLFSAQQLAWDKVFDNRSREGHDPYGLTSIDTARLFRRVFHGRPLPTFGSQAVRALIDFQTAAMAAVTSAGEGWGAASALITDKHLVGSAGFFEGDHLVSEGRSGTSRSERSGGAGARASASSPCSYCKRFGHSKDECRSAIKDGVVKPHAEGAASAGRHRSASPHPNVARSAGAAGEKSVSFAGEEKHVMGRASSPGAGTSKAVGSAGGGAKGCSFCGKAGHSVDTCFKKRSGGGKDDRGGGGGGRDSRSEASDQMCFNCGRPGHRKHDCPTPQKSSHSAGRGGGGGGGRGATPSHRS
jgi:hypothetical protein